MPYILLIILLCCSANQNDEKHILRNIILYSQHSQLLDSCNINTNSYADLDNFARQNSDQIYNAFLQTVEICTALELESQSCFEDCIYYVSPLTLLLNASTYNQTYKILNWYQMGGGPIGWYETGDPDMCSYTGGTYCFTPIPSLQEHGCCVPGTCVGEDAVKVLQENVWCYQGYNQTYTQYMFQGNVTITNRCEPLPRDFSSAGFSIVIIIFFIFVLCVIIASFKTQFLTEKLSKDTHAENVPVYDTNWFLYCFSVQNTWRIFNSRRPENKSEFNFLDGIRFVSMLWVIWGHVYMHVLLMGYSTSNGLTLTPPVPESMGPQAWNVDGYPYVSNQLYMMFVEYSFYAVDSFYYISGFLGAFSLYRQLKTCDINKVFGTIHIWIPLAYLHRVLRLLPMMAFIMFVQFFISDQLPYGYKVESRDENYWECADSWYKILLFYANLDPKDNTKCMDHLWYVQTDMQMFLLLPWIMLLYKWKALVGIIASLMPFFVCIAIRIFFAILYHLNANIPVPGHETLHGYHDTALYGKPWGRMAPYFFGSFTMLIILTFKKYKYEIRSRAIYFSVMGLSCFVMLCLVFWPWEDVKNAPRKRWSLVSNQIYYALSRPAWGVSLGLLSFTLVFKYNYFKSVIGAILALEIYQPLAKLTYTMYLIHVMVSIWFLNSVNSPFYYELWWALAVFMAISAVTMGLTIMLWFIIEQPMANIVGLCMKHVLFRKSKSKKIIDTELTSIKQDKLLIKRDTSQHSYLKNDTIGKDISGGDYESFVDATNDPHYISIKSNYDRF